MIIIQNLIYFLYSYAYANRKLCWNECTQKTFMTFIWILWQNSVLTHQINFTIGINCSVVLRMGVFECWLWRWFVAAQYLCSDACACLIFIFWQHRLLRHKRIILNITGWLFWLESIKSLSFCTTMHIIIPNRLIDVFAAEVFNETTR